MASRFKKLVISPHYDDEVLGCGGILDSKTYVLECGVENRYVPNFGTVTESDREEELDKAAELLGFAWSLIGGDDPFDFQKVNSYKTEDLIDPISHYINEIKPDQVFIPYPSYNQDHQAVYSAALVALRHHDINFFVKKVLIYEQDHAFLWPPPYETSFQPNYFAPIDVQRKIEAYKCLKSQVRSFRSPELLRELAKLRGRQGNMEYAEAFQIVRWID